jgi:hypothetical protein
MGIVLHAVDESPLTQLQIRECQKISDFSRYRTSQHIVVCHPGGTQQNKKSVRQSDSMGIVLHAVHGILLTERQTFEREENSNFGDYGTKQQIVFCHSGGIQQNKKGVRQSDSMGIVLHAVDESPLTQVQMCECRDLKDLAGYCTSQRIGGCHSGGIQQNTKSVRQSDSMGIVLHAVDESALTQIQKSEFREISITDLPWYRVSQQIVFCHSGGIQQNKESVRQSDRMGIVLHAVHGSPLTQKQLLEYQEISDLTWYRTSQLIVVFHSGGIQQNKKGVRQSDRMGIVLHAVIHGSPLTQI